jgi:hypothetical protein
MSSEYRLLAIEEPDFSRRGLRKTLGAIRIALELLVSDVG